MKNRSTKNIILISLISIFLFVFNILIKKNLIIYAESIMASFMMIIVFLSIQMYGFQKDKNNRIKSCLFLKTAQTLTIYFIVIYMLGFYFGYSKIVFSLKPMSILNNTLAPMIIFICLEVFRYVITSGNKDNKKNIILLNTIIGFIELSITTRYFYFYNLETAYKTIADYIIPVALKQIAFGFLCYYGGLKPAFLYRVVIVLYTYIIPIHPNFSDTILCMCNIILPILVTNKTTEIIEEENQEKEYKKVKNNIFGNVVITAILTALIVLISGISPVGITAVASDSMYPTFSKGAGVVTLKVKEKDLKEGDIISFNQKNKRIIHRIEKVETIEQETRYYTKGDANSSIDKGYITYKDINNKIILDIPLIGYPSIIFNELLSQ